MASVGMNQRAKIANDHLRLLSSTMNAIAIGLVAAAFIEPLSAAGSFDLSRVNPVALVAALILHMLAHYLLALQWDES